MLNQEFSKCSIYNTVRQITVNGVTRVRKEQLAKMITTLMIHSPDDSIVQMRSGIWDYSGY